MPELTDAQKVMRNNTGQDIAEQIRLLRLQMEGGGLPAGGAAGQIPVKASATDYDVDWQYPQYSRPNLLVNWDFVHPVNQGGQTTWQNVNEYTVDRWKLTSGSASLGASGLTLNGTLTQTLETAIGQTAIGSALLSEGSMISPTYNDSTKTFSITATGQTIKAVKLEIGSYQTLAHNEGTEENPDWVLNEIPDYGEELVKCNVAAGKTVEYTDRFLVLESTYEFARDLTWTAIGGGIAYSAKMQFTYNGATATTVPGYRAVAATIARFSSYRPDYQWVPYIQYNTGEVCIYSAVGANTTDFIASSHISVRAIFEKI